MSGAAGPSRSAILNINGAAVTLPLRSARPPGPHRDRHPRIVADGPGVAETVGGPGLEGEMPAAPNLRRQHPGRRWRAVENIVDVPCGGRPEDRRPARRRII